MAPQQPMAATEVMTISRERIIESWLLSAIKNRSTENFVDLHVDQIDPAWRKRDKWFDAGIEALGIATALRNRNDLPVDIVLAFSLRSGNRRRGIDFTDRATTETAFDWSPPSIYLLSPGAKPWEPPLDCANSSPPDEIYVEDLNPTLLGIPRAIKGCYFLEFRQRGSGEYCRTVCAIA